jgi:hypothetical protein
MCKTGVLTRTRAKMVHTIPKTSFAGGNWTALMSKIMMQKLSSETMILLAYAIVTMVACLVWGIDVDSWVGVFGGGRDVSLGNWTEEISRGLITKPTSPRSTSPV